MFSEMKGDVGMSLHGKGNKKSPLKDRKSFNPTCTSLFLLAYSRLHTLGIQFKCSVGKILHKQKQRCRDEVE